MARKRQTAEEIVTQLRQVDLLMSQSKSICALPTQADHGRSAVHRDLRRGTDRSLSR